MMKLVRDLKISLFLANRSLKRGNKSTVIMTIFIMTLAFINLVFVSAIFSGMIESVNVAAIDNRYANIVIEPKEGDKYIDSIKDKLVVIDSMPGVLGVSPHYIVGASISYDENNDGDDIESGTWFVKSVDVGREVKTTRVHEFMLDGEYLNQNDLSEIILGVDISGGFGSELGFQNLNGVIVGDEVAVIYLNGVKRNYNIKGIFQTKNTQTDQSAFVTKKEMESVLKMSNRASEIIIRIENKGDEAIYINELRNIGYKDKVITPWQDLMGFTANVSKSFDMISIILGVIGIIVAGITIFIVIYVNVVNKRRQIGILKAIGMNEFIIIRSYVIQTIFYSTMGILFGLIVVFFILEPLFIKFPLNFPMGWVSLQIEQKDIIVNSISLLVASIVGGFVPAYRASKESILKAIWG